MYTALGDYKVLVFRCMKTFLSMLWGKFCTLDPQKIYLVPESISQLALLLLFIFIEKCSENKKRKTQQPGNFRKKNHNYLKSETSVEDHGLIIFQKIVNETLLLLH